VEVCYRQEFIRCGREGCKSCPHGPYWYAYWWDKGRTRKKYVGKKLNEEQQKYVDDHRPGTLRLRQNVGLVDDQADVPELLTVDRAWQLIGLKPTRNQGMVRARYNSWKAKMEKGQILEGLDVVSLTKAWQCLCKENDWKA